MALLLLDLDNTLVDRDQAFSAWAQSLICRHALPVEAIAWIRNVDEGGRAPREKFLALVRERFGIERSVAALVRDWATDFPALYRCEPDVRGALVRARTEGWSLAIVTNGDVDIQMAKVRAAGLDALVDAVCVSGTDGFHKPDPRIFRRAAFAAGAAIESGWMVGDDPIADIGGGSAAGLGTVWMRRGRVWAEQSFQPDRIADGAAEAIGGVLTRPS